MLGFWIAIFPEERYISEPRYWEREARWNANLAYWETSIGGTNWIDDLVEAGNAELLEGSNGYPSRYRCRFHTISKILQGTVPKHEGTPTLGEDYFLPGGWVGKVEFHPERIAECSDDTFLIIETMDLS